MWQPLLIWLAIWFLSTLVHAKPFDSHRVRRQAILPGAGGGLLPSDFSSLASLLSASNNVLSPTPPPSPQLGGLSPEYINSILAGQSPYANSNYRQQNTNNPQLTDAFVQSCLNWLMHGVFDGLTGPTGSSTANRPQAFPGFVSAPNIPTLSFPLAAHSTDAILSRFTPEQRQMLQNWKDRKDYPEESREIRRRTPPPGPDMMQKRALRNIQILRELQMRPTTTASPPTIRPSIITDRGTIPTRALPLYHSTPTKPSKPPPSPFDTTPSLSSNFPNFSSFQELTAPTSVDNTQTIRKQSNSKSDNTNKPNNNAANDYTPDIITEGANLIFQLLQNGPQNKFVVDTGKEKFDRFLVHRLDRVDALGLPVVDGVQSSGVYWGDGNVHVVNENAQQVLGTPTSYENNGFMLPVATFLANSGSANDGNRLPRPRPAPIVPYTTTRPKCDGGQC